MDCGREWEEKRREIDGKGSKMGKNKLSKWKIFPVGRDDSLYKPDSVYWIFLQNFRRAGADIEIVIFFFFGDNLLT